MTSEAFYDDSMVALQNAIAREAVKLFEVDERSATAMASRVVSDHRTRFGGLTRYMPKKPPKELQKEQLLQEWNGRNRDELMVKYRISKATFYRWIGKN